MGSEPRAAHSSAQGQQKKNTIALSVDQTKAIEAYRRLGPGLERVAREVRTRFLSETAEQHGELSKFELEKKIRFLSTTADTIFDSHFKHLKLAAHLGAIDEAMRELKFEDHEETNLFSSFSTYS